MPDFANRNALVLSRVQDSTCDVFSTMLGLTLTRGSVGVETRSTIPSEGVVALVGMAGAVSGNGCLFMSRRFACRAASYFLMEEYEEVCDEVLDAAAELTNMIVGGLKTALEEQLGPMALSLPTIVYGNNYITRSSALGQRLIARFDCEEIGEGFSVLVSLIPENQNRSCLSALAEFHARVSL